MATIFGQQVEKPYNVNHGSSFKGGVIRDLLVDGIYVYIF